MKRYSVQWAVTAQQDLEQIAEFIAHDRVINAVKVVKRIERLAQSLVSLPTRGRIVPELRWHGITRYHELIMKPWRILYRIDNSMVYVVGVLDGRRQVEDLLIDRFANR
jgi:plasmid stabilization system protein ParE